MQIASAKKKERDLFENCLAVINPTEVQLLGFCGKQILTMFPCAHIFKRSERCFCNRRKLRLVVIAWVGAPAGAQFQFQYPKLNPKPKSNSISSSRSKCNLESISPSSSKSNSKSNSNANANSNSKFNYKPKSKSKSNSESNSEFWARNCFQKIAIGTSTRIANLDGTGTAQE